MNDETIEALREEVDRLTTQLEQMERQRRHEYFSDSPSMYNMVRKFHEVYDLDISDDPIQFATTGVGDIYGQGTLWRLRLELVREEFREFENAMYQLNLVEIADAIMDLHYVLSGTCVSFGIPEDACFAEVQRSNMSKLGEDGKPIVREDGKILKGPNFSPPDLRSIIYGSDPQTA